MKKAVNLIVLSSLVFMLFTGFVQQSPTEPFDGIITNDLPNQH